MPKRSTLRLTKRIVDRLTADGKDTIFWDRDLAGFGVRVHTTGRKLYIVQSRGPAGLKRVTLGRVGTETVDARRREAAEVIDRIKRGEDPKPAPPPTVADLAARWLKTHVEARCRPNTAHGYRLALRNHILPALGEEEASGTSPPRTSRRCITSCATCPTRPTTRSGSCPGCSSWPRPGRWCRPAAIRAGMSATSGRRPASAS